MPKFHSILSYFLLLFLANSFYCFSQKKEKKLYLITYNVSAELKDTLDFNNYKEIDTHIIETTKELQQSGHLSSYFEKPIKENDSTFRIRLIKTEKTNFIKINNWDSLPREVKKKATPINSKSKNIFKVAQLQLLMKTINQIYSNSGNPFNSAQLTDFKKKQDTLSAYLNITTKKKRIIDSLVVKGYPKFPLGFLKHYVDLRKGTLFQNKKIKEQTLQINNLPFANNSRPAEILFNTNQTVLYLYLKKKVANNFDGFLGFSTDEENGNLVLDGYLNLNLVNNLNFGEEIALIYKSDSEEQQQFKLNTKLPYIFDLPLSLEAGLEIFRQKDEFSSTTQNIGFSYAFSPKIETLLGYKKTESADLNENENLVSINQNFDATFFNSEIRYIYRQASLLFPIKTKIVFGAEAGNRKQGNINQHKLSLNVQQIFQLNQRNSIYIANNAQFFQSNNYFPNELYRLGGILSIRGFEENSLRASLFNVLNTEYRFQLNETIYVHSIIDFAFIDNQSPRTTAASNIVGSNKLTSFGVGFGMLTKAGLFKLNYANGKSSSIPFEFGNSKVHISLIAFF